MKKFDRTSLIVVAAIVAVSVAAGIYTTKHAKKGAPSVAAYVVKNPISLQELCNCSAVVSDGTATLILDTATGKTASTLAEGTDPALAAFQSRVLSPTGTSELFVSDDYQTLYYVAFSDNTPKKVFTAPTGDVISYVAWSPDGNTVAFGIGAVVADAAEQSVSTELYTLDLAKGTTEKSFTTASVVGEPLTTAIPISVTNGGKRIIVASMSETDVAFYYGDHGAKNLVKVPVPLDISIYYTHAGGTIDRLLWGASDGLHTARTKDFTAETFVLTTWSDAPYSVPSPDGSSLVYLKPDSRGTGGYPTLLKLDTGAETQLTTDVVSDAAGLESSHWTHDGKWFVFVDTTTGTPHSRALDITNTDQRIRDISDPLLPSTYQLYAFIPKST